MDKIKNGDYKVLGVCFLLAVGLLWLSAYFLPAACAVPFVLAFAIVANGAAGAVAAALCFAAIALLHPHLAALLAAALLPLSFAAGFTVRRQLRFFHSVLATTAAALAGAAGALGLLWLFTGQGPVDYAAALFGEFLQAQEDAYVTMLYQIARYPDLLSGAITQEALLATPPAQAIETLQELLREGLNYSLVSYLTAYALTAGLIGFTVTRAVAKRRHIETAPMPPFSDWTLPRRFWLGFLLSYLVTLFGASYWTSFYIAQDTIISAYGLVFIVQGLSFLDYIFKKRNLGKGVRVLLHVVLTMLLGYMLVFVGLFENIAGMRKRFEGGAVL